MDAIGELDHSKQSEVNAVKQWRDIVIEHKASELAWAKGITGRWVEFPQSAEKSSFGLEVVIPVKFDEVSGIYAELVKKFAKEEGYDVSDIQLQEGIKEKLGTSWYSDSKIPLPDNIQRVRLISLSPQETLPPRLRTIESDRSVWKDEHPLVPLTRQPSDRPQVFDDLTKDTIASQRLEMLRGLFHDTFASRDKIKQFEEDLKSDGVEEVLIIQGHGGYDNMTGEQTEPVKPLITHIEEQKVNLSDNQVPGNRIDLNEIVSKYDNPINGAILINTCYLGKDDLSDGGHKNTIYRLAGTAKAGVTDYPFSLFLTRNSTLVSKSQ